MKQNKNQKNTAVNQITEGVIWKQLLIFFFPILFGTLFQLSQQFLMGSFLHDGSTINDKNLIRIFNRRQSMGNRYDCFTMCQCGNSLLNQMLMQRLLPCSWKSSG